MIGTLPGGSLGSSMRATSLRVLKSTTTNPLRLPICTKIERLEPSGFLEIAIGRISSPSLTAQAGASFSVSRTLTYPFFEASPATTFLPSGVTYRLWTGPSVRMLLILVREAVSMTSATPRSEEHTSELQSHHDLVC